MPRFTSHVNEKRKRQKRFRVYFFGFIGGLSALFSILWYGKIEFFQYASFFILMSGVSMALDTFKKIGKNRSIEIDEHHIEWSIFQKNQGLASVEWKDIRWLKKEYNNSVSIFMDSSFNKNISMTDFSEEDKKEMLRLFQKYGVAKEIRLVNFSDLALAIA
ncbi:MAG: hypothetical protein ABIS69_07360 [Sediminibacterium sp.]